MYYVSTKENIIMHTCCGGTNIKLKVLDNLSKITLLHAYSQREDESLVHVEHAMYTLMPGCGELLLSALGFSPRGLLSTIVD